MKFRTIKPEEQEQAIFIISQAFYYDCKGEYKLLEKGKFRYEEFLAAFDDKNNMLALLQCEPHFMWLDSSSVKSGGIANVATLPENRRGGLVKSLMHNICDKMYATGYVMSFLYPFSYEYYRKFGYEFCAELTHLSASPEALSRLPFNGKAKQFEPGENGTDPTDVIEIYNAFSQKYNIMLDRDAWQWERKLEHDPVQSKTRTYVVYDSEDTAQAYFTYTYERTGSTSELSIKDLAWKDSSAMKLLFAFIGRLFGNVIKIDFNVPPEMHASLFWANPYECEIKVKPNGMARVINAKAALELINKHSKCGSFTIKINDEFMQQNNKSYKVSWEGGKSKAEEYDGICDIECSIAALTQMITGFADLELAAARDDVTINTNKDLLKSVFYKKMIYIADFF